MGKMDSIQLNIRSRFARERAARLAGETGMTVTQIVEEALRAYQPAQKAASGGLVRKGPILVRPAGGRTISASETDALIDEVRNERG
jgi:hypothetical protein